MTFSASTYYSWPRERYEKEFLFFVPRGGSKCGYRKRGGTTATDHVVVELAHDTQRIDIVIFTVTVAFALTAFTIIVITGGRREPRLDAWATLTLALQCSAAPPQRCVCRAAGLATGGAMVVVVAVVPQGLSVCPDRFHWSIEPDPIPLLYFCLYSLRWPSPTYSFLLPSSSKRGLLP